MTLLENPKSYLLWVFMFLNVGIDEEEMLLHEEWAVAEKYKERRRQTCTQWTSQETNK